MEIILTTSVDGLGGRGDIVQVKDGYARNFLLPRKMALPATRAMKKVMNEENKLQDIRGDKEKRIILEAARKMKDISVTIVVQSGEEDKLYGSVSEYDIARAITELGFKVDHHMVRLEEHIKLLGVYTVAVELHKEVEIQVKVWVVKE